MTSRKQDELDLTAMSIADMVKNSDNLRVPRNPEKALSDMARLMDVPHQPEGLSYRCVSVKGRFGGEHFKGERNKSLIDFVSAGNTHREAAEFFGISDSPVGQILKRGY